jgi:hypothetical protein
MFAYWHVPGVNLRSAVKPEVEALVTVSAIADPADQAGQGIGQDGVMSEAPPHPTAVPGNTDPADPDQTGAAPAAAGADPAGTPADGAGDSGDASAEVDPDDGTEPDPEAEAVVNDPAVNRSARRPRDMVFSMIVLMIPVLLIVLAYRNLYGGDTVVTVDPTGAIAAAQRAGLTPTPPTTGPTDWQTVAAQFQDGTLRLGLHGPDGEGLQLIQSTRPAAELVRSELDAAAVPHGELVVDERSWQRFTAGDKEALLLDLPTSRVLVIGDAVLQPVVADWFTP